MRPNPPPFLDKSIATLLREMRDAGEAPLVAVVSLGRFGPSCGSARAWPTLALHDRRMPLTIQRQQAFVTLAGRLRKLRYKGGVPSSYRPGRGGSDFGVGGCIVLEETGSIRDPIRRPSSSLPLRPMARS